MPLNTLCTKLYSWMGKKLCGMQHQMAGQLPVWLSGTVTKPPASVSYR
jgi:hypothetical protein